ncbi:hypothetical protein I317_05274 [Kwoniella heveanensis CBS 569]|uniref:Uncharacterized protein n=1 Tax=Kwoniella heveanensis BCC8398 TaxID=1296120 RepID=A0A1B9H2C5_9TREE|nr:hypothetical protein I316_00546 [Kwoniella heveanensis BCC8398]OCF40915.1 hypothetical protein I317_05274 [Kwoniella heveanensis CBS 569]
MLVHPTPPLPPRVPIVRPIAFSPHHRTASQTQTRSHSRSPLAPPPFFRRTSSLRDPPPGESRSPSVVASEQDEDEFMAHQTRAGRRKGRRKDDRGRSMDCVPTPVS